MKWYKLDYFIVGAILLLQFSFTIRGFQYWFNWGFEEKFDVAEIHFMWVAVYTCILIGYYIFRKVFNDSINRIVGIYFTE